MVTGSQSLEEPLPPGLYVISTPIGNLEDITLRALKVLRRADVLLAEDTRRARILFQHYQINKRPLSYHDHNEAIIAPKIVQWIREGKAVGLISDAGTPTIADPGYRAIRSVIEEGLPLFVIPGPSAVTAALPLAGIGAHRFVFERFLPPRKGRTARLEELASEERTIVLFESPHRLVKTLNDIISHLGANRQAAVLRELTKLHEEVRRGTLGELRDYFACHPPRGEFVLVIEGLSGSNRSLKNASLHSE
ncbi:MAG: 16S rRNA (cytidine(1402)-2'-O)-methyltransferase [bacterium]